MKVGEEKLKNLDCTLFLLPLFLLGFQDDEGAERIIVRADRSLYFPAVELFRHALSKAVEESNSNQSPQAIVIDMSRVNQVDHSSLKVNECKRFSFYFC